MGKKKSKSTTNQSSTTQNIIPAWVEQNSAWAVAKGRSLAEREYTPYTDQRFADMSDEEQQGIDLWRERSGDYQGYLDRAGQEADRASQSWLDADQQAYMNPYIESALEPSLRGMREDMAESWRDTGGQAAMAGAFGGSRATLMQTEQQRRGTEALGDARARGMAAAYADARSAFDSDRSAANQAVRNFASLGDQGQQQLASQVEGLMQTGELKRMMEQVNLDFDYAQFMDARDWDVNNLQNLITTLQSVPYSSTQTNVGTSTTNTTKSGSALGMVVGAAAMVVGAVTANPALVAGGANVASGSM